MSLDSEYRPKFHFTPIKNWMNDPNGQAMAGLLLAVLPIIFFT